MCYALSTNVVIDVSRDLNGLGLSDADIEELQELSNSISNDDLDMLRRVLENISEKELELLAELSDKQLEQFYSDKVGNIYSDSDNNYNRHRRDVTDEICDEEEFQESDSLRISEHRAMKREASPDPEPEPEPMTVVRGSQYAGKKGNRDKAKDRDEEFLREYVKRFR